MLGKTALFGGIFPVKSLYVHHIYVSPTEAEEKISLKINNLLAPLLTSLWSQMFT